MNIYRGLSRLPSVDEVGVDLVRLKFCGRWLCRQNAGSSLQQLHDHLRTIRENVPHLEQMGRLGRRTFLSLLSTAPLTIRSAKMTFVDDPRSAHNLFIELAINPTRTLNRLLATYARERGRTSGVSFLDWLSLMPPEEFFHDPRRASNAEQDNLIAWPVAAQLELGRDPFGTFLPIYCQRLEDWLIDLLAASDANETEQLPSQIAVSAGSMLFNLDLNNTRLLHCEVYFERQIASAPLVVERIARRALAGLNNVTARRYDANDTPDPDTLEHLAFNEVERVGSGIGVTAPLTSSGSRLLLIYAKRDDRIRFELKHEPCTRRLAPNQHTRCAGPLANELLARLEAARLDLPHHAHWTDALAFAEAQQHNSTTALIELVATFGRMAATYSEASFESAIHDLIVTGGLSPAADQAELVSLAEAFVRRGVLINRRVRVRDRSGIGRRYTLAEPYLSMREMIMGALDEALEAAQRVANPI
jgi:hypothetical protein